MPNAVPCAHILVKTAKDATGVLERLKKREKFTTIVKDVSICPSKKRDGDLRTLGRVTMVKEFKNPAFALQKGQILPITQTECVTASFRRGWNNPLTNSLFQTSNVQ